jgi:LysR family transcriptional regulator (chromosome initiation inhibitor)
MIDALLERGELVQLSPGRHLDVDLYWQSWRLSIGWLDEFSAALKQRAAEFLD